MSEDYDKSENLKIAFEELERARFKKSPSGKIAIRVSNEEEELSGFIFDYGTAGTMYYAEGLHGALTSEPKWKIRRLQISTDARVMAASEGYDQIWDNRASLTYV